VRAKDGTPKNSHVCSESDVLQMTGTHNGNNETSRHDGEGRSKHELSKSRIASCLNFRWIAPRFEPCFGEQDYPHLDDATPEQRASLPRGVPIIANNHPLDQEGNIATLETMEHSHPSRFWHLFFFLVPFVVQEFSNLSDRCTNCFSWERSGKRELDILDLPFTDSTRSSCPWT